MHKLRFLGIGLFMGLALAGCLRMDDLLFNPDTDITEYQFEGWGEWGSVLDESYAIEDSMISLFTLPSQAADEAAPTEIYAAYIGDPGRITTDTVILYMHGNGSHMDGYWQRVKLLANMGWKHRFGVLEMDYRGYGLSEGAPSEAGLYADVSACMDWLAQMGLTGDRLVMYGYSMGTAPATELTANSGPLVPGWLCLEAPFASAEVMGQASTGLAMPGSFFTNLKIDNAEEIKKVEQPFFWIHGTADDFIDFESHGEVVWKNYSGSRGVDVRVEGADHGDIQSILGVENYTATLLSFITGQ